MRVRQDLFEERIITDVLVIGAGAGGLMAAISAADCGTHVTLCEKGNAGRLGGIPSGNDHFVCYIPGIHKPSIRTQAISDLMGRIMVDEDLLFKWIDLSYIALQKCESLGINIKINGHYEFKGHLLPGSTGKMGEPGKTDRLSVRFSDNKACAKLEKQARERGVNIMNRVMVTELLRNANGRVVSAVGISTREPKFIVFQAKNIVINKGDVEATRLYPSPNINLS